MPFLGTPMRSGVRSASTVPSISGGREPSYDARVTASIESDDAEFDSHAGRYREMHAAVLTASGEGPEYFAQYKLRVVRDITGSDARPVLDYGCGIGNLTQILGDGHTEVHGYDPSTKSVETARERAPFATFHDRLDDVPRDHFGTIVLANVLHHVRPRERAGVLRDVVPMLAAGGRVMIFEHNRWNPLTVRAVRRCEFDEGVSLLSEPELSRLLEESGLTEVRTRFIVFFPKVLRPLRRLEPHLGRLPLGAQMCVWGTRRPDGE